MINETETMKRPAYSAPIEIAKIRRDGGTQSRVNMYDSIVEEYAEAMRAGVQFPPVLGYFDGESFWLADGFHRVAAAEAAGLEKISAQVYTGTQRDAVLRSVGVNATHGLRRTNDDKRRAVETLLRDPEWREWSDREIGRTAGVDHKTVGKWRADLIQRGEIPHMSAVAPQTATADVVIEVEVSYPAHPSDDANVEAARQIALEILTRWSRDDLKDVLRDGFTGGVPDGISYRLGAGEIVIDDNVAVPVDRKQIGIALTTANGTGVYRFEAIPLKDWSAERDALIGNPKVIEGLWSLLTGFSYLDYQVRPLLEKYGLAVTEGRSALTPSGRAMIDAYIAENPTLSLQLEIQRSGNLRAAMGDMEKLLRQVHGKQAKSGAWVPIEAGWNDNGALGWAEILAKKGYLVGEKRKRVDGYGSDKGMRFFVMTDKGCELIGAKLLPTPDPLPDLAYHHDAGVFIPDEPVFSVKVGDAVKERKGKKMGKVVELGKWPLVYIQEPGVNWKSSVYDTRIEVIETEPGAPANPLRLRELDDQAQRVWDAMKVLKRSVEAWTSDEDDSPVGVNTRDLVLTHLTDMMIWTAETHSGVRLKLEAPEPISIEEDEPDDLDENEDYYEMRDSDGDPEPVESKISGSIEIVRSTLYGLDAVQMLALLKIEEGPIDKGWAEVNVATLVTLSDRLLIYHTNGTHALTPLGQQVADLAKQTRPEDHPLLRQKAKDAAFFNVLSDDFMGGIFSRSEPEMPTPTRVHQSSDVAKTTLETLAKHQLAALLAVESGAIAEGWATVNADTLDDLEYRMLITEKNGEYSLTGLGAQVAARALAQAEATAEAPDSDVVFYDDVQPFPED